MVIKKPDLDVVYETARMEKSASLRALRRRHISVGNRTNQVSPKVTQSMEDEAANDL